MGSEVTSRFVCQQQRRFGRQCTGNGRPLLLSSGQLIRLGFGELIETGGVVGQVRVLQKVCLSGLPYFRIRAASGLGAVLLEMIKKRPIWGFFNDELPCRLSVRQL